MKVVNNIVDTLEGRSDNEEKAIMARKKEGNWILKIIEKKIKKKS